MKTIILNMKLPDELRRVVEQGGSVAEIIERTSRTTLSARNIQAILDEITNAEVRMGNQPTPTPTSLTAEDWRDVRAALMREEGYNRTAAGLTGVMISLMRRFPDLTFAHFERILRSYNSNTFLIAVPRAFWPPNTDSRHPITNEPHQFALFMAFQGKAEAKMLLMKWEIASPAANMEHLRHCGVWNFLKPRPRKPSIKLGGGWRPAA